MATVCTSVVRQRAVVRARTPRMSDAGLLVLKAALMLAGAAALLWANQLRDAQAWAPLTNEWQGHSIRYPRGWWIKKEGIRLATVISEVKSDHMEISPALTPAPRGIQVRLERIESGELAANAASSIETLALAACGHIGIEIPAARRLTTFMSRRAIELSGPRPGGWGAVVAVEDRGAFMLLQVAAPSRFDFERAASTWRAIAASVRPVPLRCYADLAYPPADPSDPGCGPGGETPR